MNICKVSALLLLVLPTILLAQSGNLIHQYKFDGNVNDAVGDSNGVFVAGVTASGLTGATAPSYATGRDGTPNGAIVFDGNDSNVGFYMIDVGRFSPVKEGVDGEMTVAFWAKWGGPKAGIASDYQDIIAKRDNWAIDQMEWGINHHSATNYHFSVRRSGSMNCDSDSGMTQNEWTHVAITIGATGDCKFYKNGQWYFTGYYEYGTKNDAMIHVGTSVNSSSPNPRAGDSYKGALDDLRFYSRVLTAGEILSVYQDATAVDDNPSSVPTQFGLAQNFPNPFNPSTEISYQLPENSLVTLRVYDMLGKEVATLVNGNASAGYHNVSFDASRLTSGSYICTLQANNFIQSRKMLLLK